MSRTTLVDRIESYLTRYVSFTNPDQAFACALWTIATHCWPTFDAFPYMAITSATKRSGKTRLSELVGFVSANALATSAATGPSLYALVEELKPTLIMDEAEDLNKESASVIRSFLNVGYRKGQTIPRRAGKEVKYYSAYCPKVFVLIGDVYDTLRDRCIIMRLRRGTAPARFLYESASTEGHALRDEAADTVRDSILDIEDAYRTHPDLSFLSDRDAEIWTALFAICTVIAPERLPQLERTAVDLSMEKTEPATSYIMSKDAEIAAEEDEYATRLLRDLRAVIDGKRGIFSADAIAKLRDLPTAPWRKYKGDGLTAISLSQLLDRFGLAPKVIRLGSGKESKVSRGYRREDVDAAMRKHNVQA